MKKTLLFTFLAACAASASAEVGDVHVMDLRNGDFSYNESTKEWSEVYNTEILTVDVDIFSALHTATDWGGGIVSFNGFFPSTSTDNTDHTADSWTANQWGCMAGGAVKVDADGTVVTEADGTVATEPGAPFLIDCYSAWSGTTSSSIYLSTDESMFAESIYMCQHPWAYFGCESGDGYARAFNLEDDQFTVTINALNTKMEPNGKSVTVVMANTKEDGNGGYVANQSTNWQKVDLSSLGLIGGIYITMDSSDSGNYGMNTAAYVCLDRFTVVSKDATSISEVSATDNSDATYYTLQGVKMPAGATLPAGTYVKVVGNQSSKVMIR